ncbi:hypothetical protein ACL598_16715 [Bordetella bronchialis]|uniref:hypothetical protein n=1 Tax=Bordetella bronchialis TaxID=463025 RepID=UPI003CFE9F5E
MKPYRPAPVLFAALCALLSGCAHPPPADPGPPVYSAAPESSGTGSVAPSGPRPALTIQSGEGEKLNLPWFVRDATDWINERSAPPPLERPPGS